jgi:hypothetical protein
MANVTQFYRSPLLSNLALRWRNTKMIAERLLPTVKVPKDQFGYLRFDQDVAYRIYDDRMAPFASANQLDMLATQVFTQITDKALKAYIDPKEVQQIDSFSVQAIKTSMLREALGLAQENRAAVLLRNTATYAGGNSTTLSGTGQWDNAAGDPKNAVLNAKRGLLIPSDCRVVMWMGKAVWDGLQQNAKVITAVQYTNQGAVDTRPMLAQYLQVDEIVVGEAFSATNNMGQTLATQRVWGSDAGLIVVNNNAPTGMGQLPTFGVCAASSANGGLWNTYVGRDADRGTQEGVTVVKVEGAYDFIVQANTLGFLWKSAVSFS